MPQIRPGVRRLFDLMLRRRDVARRDVGAEVSLHLELRVEQLVQQGLSRDDARREAERRFGSIESVIPSLTDTAYRRDRRMWLRDWLDSVTQDVRYALRGLRREPAFTGFAIASAGAGIGANAAMYGVVDRLLLRGPDHVREADRVVRFTITVDRHRLRRDLRAGRLRAVWKSPREYPRVRGRRGYAVSEVGLGKGRDAQTIRGGAATADFFPLAASDRRGAASSCLTRTTPPDPRTWWCWETRSGAHTSPATWQSSAGRSTSGTSRTQ
jgi:hypothetical protein